MEFQHLGKSVNHPQTPKEATLETFENQYQNRNYLIQFALRRNKIAQILPPLLSKF